MAKLNDYTAVTRFDSNGILITDGSSGTRKITANNAALDLADRVSAVQHRNVYGGRNLGNTITDAQWAAISSGTFDNLFIGDYWTINSTRWVIADAGAWYDSSVELMNEVMVYGCYHNASMNKGSTAVNKYTTAKHQLALFQLSPQMTNHRVWFWMRNTVSSTNFAAVAYFGYAGYIGASTSLGVRPYAVVGV